MPVPERSNQPGAELGDVAVEQEEDRATQGEVVEDDEKDEDSEDDEDPMTMRQLLTEATENLAARLLRTYQRNAVESVEEAGRAGSPTPTSGP